MKRPLGSHYLFYPTSEVCALVLLLVLSALGYIGVGGWGWGGAHSVNIGHNCRATCHPGGGGGGGRDFKYSKTAFDR